LNLQKAVVVGSSMGGWMALEMAVRDTSRIESLVLVGPAGIAAPGVHPADIFLMPPEEVIRSLFHDPKLAEQRLAEPVTPQSGELEGRCPCAEPGGIASRASRNEAGLLERLPGRSPRTDRRRRSSARRSGSSSSAM